MSQRMIAAWCPDWPVTTARINAGVPADAPIAVITANRVVACSYPARAAGVRRGLLRRESQARCPELIVLPRNEAAEARLFEPVVVALESIAPGVEITRPGLAAIGAQRPDALLRRRGGRAGRAVAGGHERRQIAELAGSEVDLLIGVADGAFAAEQAARRGVIIAPGDSPGLSRPAADHHPRPGRRPGLVALIDLLNDWA